VVFVESIVFSFKKNEINTVFELTNESDYVNEISSPVNFPPGLFLRSRRF